MHKLTISEMPKHNHQITNFLDTWGSITIIGPGSGGWLLTVPSTNLPTTLDSGGDQPHSIMPPYYSLAYIMKL
ncbi:hypothetical protein [Anaeromusa acidaminophila]|uniref:hypothetical protein n=1 Tax=Anaeromusa acidaminophila TaxID=81464 RepID=UPI0012EA557E|nr:hypothetical protein [Anaeromusa acidaminophila]